MSNEIQVSVSLVANKPSVMSQPVGRSVGPLLFSMTGTLYVGPSMIAVSTLGSVIPVGQVVQPHWAFFKNLDPTNYLTLRNGASNPDFAQLYPGECCLVPLLTTGTYYAYANTATCDLEYLIFSL